MNRMVLGLAAACSLAATAIVPASAQAIPGGSYQQSCSNVRVRGDRLTASCTASNGQLVRSSIALGACRGGDIANTNGQLTCNGGYGFNNNGYGYGNGRGYARHHRDNGYGNNGYNNGYGNGRYNNGYGNNGYLPGGSYQGSCTNAYMNGNVLTASCTAANGARITTSINANRCRGGDIANVNGRLQCR